MSWMGRIYTDAEHLQEVMADEQDTDPGELGYKLQEEWGWICPTVAGLTRSLITEVMERTPPNEADREQFDRVLGLLGTGV